ncbi:ABC transporter transmembrane domain-containing protein [Nonomuraea sp. N2-4H]|uniref:ABC transporter transmembrane domain-containing protein n=1 Tax=Nonomuraea sp. N2-4H TaxID=3128898 RepID=UPI003256375B
MSTGTETALAILRTASAREAARWVVAHCRDTPWLTAATAVTTVAGAALQVLPVFLLGQVVDGVIAGKPHDLLVTIGVLLALALLLGTVAAAASSYLIGRLGADLLARLREGAVRAVLGLPSARIEQVGHGDVLSRVGDDVAVVSKGIRTAIPTLFSAAVLVVIATAGMFGLDWRLGLAGAGALPAYALALRWYLPRSAPLYRRQREAQADRAQALISGLNGIGTVRAYRLEPLFRERVARESWRVRNLGIQVFRLFGRFVGRENRAEFIGLTLIIVAGYVLLETGQITLGEASVAPLLFHRLFNPLGSIMFTFDEAQKSGASLARLVGVLSEATQERLAGAPDIAPAGPGPQAVTVEGLTFGYPGSDRPVLRDVNLTIPAGRSLALVGATGAGKTTLAALIAGIGTPQAGGAHRLDLDLRPGRGGRAGTGEHPHTGDARVLRHARRRPAAGRAGGERRRADGRAAHGGRGAVGVGAARRPGHAGRRGRRAARRHQGGAARAGPAGAGAGAGGGAGRVDRGGGQPGSRRAGARGAGRVPGAYGAVRGAPADAGDDRRPHRGAGGGAGGRGGHPRGAGGRGRPVRAALAGLARVWLADHC